MLCFKGRTIRKVMGGGEFSSRRNFFRPLHEYFLGLIGVQEFFLIKFSRARIFFCTSPPPPPPHKFSNGPSLKLCKAYVPLASPQTSCGVCFSSSRIHFFPRTSAKHSRHLRSPITDRLRIFVKRNPSRLFRFARSVRLLIGCARSL